MTKILDNMNNPLISVVVPVYNVEKYLRQCIDSILSQTYMNLEIILVDDGSRDSSGSICDEYAKIDNRIVVLHKPNGGLSSARNAGIDIAKGEYIGFVDSDDWIEHDMYERLFDSICESGADIAVCGLFREYVNRTVNCSNTGENKVYDSSLAVQKLIENSEIQDYAVTKLYNRKLWHDVRFPVGKYYEDMLTTYKLFLQSDKIAIINKCLYHYRQRKGSIVRNGFNDVRLAYLEAAESFLENSELKEKYADTIDLRIYKVKYQLLWELFLFGDKLALRHYDTMARSWYKSIRSGRFAIVSNASMSKMMKLMANLSFLPYGMMWSLFRIKRYKSGDNNYYD